MSNIPISSLPLAISLTGSEAVPLVQSGTTKSATVTLINAQNVANIPAGGTTGQGLVKSSNVDYATQWKTVSGFGTVQEVDTGTGLTGGPITLTGTVSLAPITSHTLLANITGGSAAPIPNTPSSVLDLIGSTQGDILYRSATGWTVLPPGSNGQILTTGGASANPAWSAVGSGSVQSVGLALPGIFTVSGSPVTTTGTLTGTLATQSANLVWAGPTTGAAAAPTFRSLVGADLPNPSASSLGGIQSTTGASHQWISSISTSGIPGLTQPAFTDISGTVAAAQLPNPTTGALGGVRAINAVTSNWINSINTSGIPQLSQPAFSDISGNAILAQLPSIGNNSILSNISGGSSTPLGNGLSSIIDSAIGSTQGDILYRNASNWTVLAPGTSGQVLSTGGAAANPSWATVTGTGTVTSVATNNGLTGGTITTTGTIGLASISTGNVLAYTGAGSGVPVATTPTAVLDVIASTEGDILYRGASTWSALTPGTNGQFLQTAGAGSTPSWAGAVTSVAGNGVTITSTGTIPPHYGIVNQGLAVSASAGALTINLTDNGGSTPSASSPVSGYFRNVTGTTGSWTQVNVTSSLSLTIPSGATMNVTSSTAFRLWVVLFNNAGTAALGVINCSDGSHIYPLVESVPTSTTAISSSSNSGGVIYTGSALTSKAFLIVGFLEWGASGLTAGTWTTSNLLLVQSFGPGIRKPGDIIQRVLGSSSTIASFAGTSFAVISGGVTASITPSSAANPILVETQGALSNGSAVTTYIQLSRGTTLIGFPTAIFPSAGNQLIGASVKSLDNPNTLSSTTYQVQGKVQTSSTGFYPNGTTGGVTAIGASLDVTEFQG